MTETEGLGELYEMSRASPIVNAHWRLMESRGFTREALIALAVDLAKQNVELVNRAIDAEMKRPIAPVVVVK